MDKEALDPILEGTTLLFYRGSYNLATYMVVMI